VFGWYENRADAEAAAAAMQGAFAAEGMQSDAFVAPIESPAAGLIERVDDAADQTPMP
jgi:homoserine kinase